MKFFRLFLLVCALSAVTMPAMAQSKIAIIDLRKVFDGYWKTKKADSSLKEQAGDLDRSLKKMEEDFSKQKEEYNGLLKSASDQAISSQERDKKKKQSEEKLVHLEEMQTGIQQFKRTASSTMIEKQRRMRDDVLKEIRETINTKAKAGGFSLVLDSASESVNNTPVVLFSNNENDLTEEVLKELNVNAPAGILEEKKLEEKKDSKDKK